MTKRRKLEKAEKQLKNELFRYSFQRFLFRHSVVFDVLYLDIL
jgi:hypothetical protein